MTASRVDGLIELLVKASSNGEEEEEEEDDEDAKLNSRLVIEDRDKDYVSIILIHRGFCNKNSIDWIQQLVDDACKVYSYLQNKQRHTGYYEQLSKPSHSDFLVKLVESSPMRSFLRLTFRQIMFFILDKRKTHMCQIDLAHLLRFIDELKAAHSTLCLEDKQVFKSALAKLSLNFGPVHEDAAILINWAIIEAAKLVVMDRFTSTDSTPKQFLDLLQKECLKTPVAFGSKINRQLFSILLQNIDKHLSDRIYEFGTSKYTFSCSPEHEQFYKDNRTTLRSWLLKNRQSFARFNLAIDNPSECWRNMNIRMFIDLNTKYQNKTVDGTDNSPSFSQTLMSLNTKNWYANICLLALSAKSLNDDFLLQGINSLTELSGVLCKFPPLAAMLSNLTGNYEGTYALLKDTKEFQDQQTLIEFLDSCVELGNLDENAAYISQLKSNKLRYLYQSYLDAMTGKAFKIDHVEEVKRWLLNWTTMGEECSNSLKTSCVDELTIVRPTSHHMDLIIPACLSMITKAPQENRTNLVDHSKWLISQDFIAQSFVSPNFFNTNTKVYQLLLELFKFEDDAMHLPEDLVQLHSKDLQWNHLLYKHLCDLNLIDNFKTNQNLKVIDLIKYKAAKFNNKRRNFRLSVNLAEQLSRNAQTIDMRVHSFLLLMKNGQTNSEHISHLLNIVSEMRTSKELDEVKKHDLIFKILRSISKSNQKLFEQVEKELFKEVNGEIEPASGLSSQGEGDSLENRWQTSLSSASFRAETKTLLLFSRLANKQLDGKPVDSTKLLNSTLALDMKLLEYLSKSRNEKRDLSAIECSARILEKVASKSSELDRVNLNKFSDDGFIKITMNSWVKLKSNLLPLIFDQENMDTQWRKALLNLVKVMGKQYPSLLIYSIIVNRLDLEDELVYLSDKTSWASIENMDSFLMADGNACYSSTASECRNNSESKSTKFIDCQRRLSLWNELLDFIQTGGAQVTENKWRIIVSETERFLKEIRKISYLCGEYFRSLTLKLPKRLYSFLDYYSKYCDPATGLIKTKQRLEDCKRRLRATCDQALQPLKVIITYGKRVGQAHMTKYELWFFDIFSKHLNELEYRLNLLGQRKLLNRNDLENLVRCITELLTVCRTILYQHNVNNRQKLYMELISPMLSRLEPSQIPMPDCCDQLIAVHKSKSIVTVHKISQTVNLIVSKTSPKKLKITGSDGVSRAFLLKAHEDLRLDQLIMDLFGSVNILLMSQKEGSNGNYRLRRYSVTPVSSRSGLIQWIEAPSLCSTYRAWLHGPNGKKVTEELYAKTCSALCDQNKRNEQDEQEHLHCRTPQTSQSVDLFYQLLWAKTKPSRHALTQTKPFHGNIIRYRAEFEPDVFEQVVEELINRLPSELVANQLWHKSINSHSYYLKTQEFIRSNATISMIGYIIGLGDRHPENILLDHSTGEVIHIDYNICFELGKALSIPERVPFRLTQNLIHAFGFAGLEGGFRLSCVNVLDTLKNFRQTLLHLLHPINLDFMIGQPTSKSTTATTTLEEARLNCMPKPVAKPAAGVMIQSKSSHAILAPKSISRSNIDMDMCSQESLDLSVSGGATPTKGATGCDVSDLLILNHSAPTKAQSNFHPQTSDLVPALVSCKIQETVATPLFDLQHNITTPTKIPPNIAQSIYERIKEKLTGTDESLHEHKITLRQKIRSSTFKSCHELVSDEEEQLDSADRVSDDAVNGDLILLDDVQATDDQVDALIIKATSIKNKAAMFEGWMPWI